MIVTAPEPLPSEQNGKSLFLAGGITNVEDWQSYAIERLSLIPCTLYNPRRVFYDLFDKAAADVQIEWEFYALEAADAVLFWFADADSVQPITLYELGSWARADKPLFVGTHPRYPRSIDVQKQLSLLRPDLTVHEDLDKLLAAAAQFLSV